VLHGSIAQVCLAVRLMGAGGTVLTWSVNASGQPSPRSYAIAMLAFASALFGALLCAVRIPRPVPVTRPPPAAAVPAAT
jgi:hypothetical protein